MDLHIVGAEPTDDERAAIDALLGPPESGWVGGVRDIARDGRMALGGLATTRDRRDLLLPALHAAQDRAGWISRGALNYICRRLSVPPAEAWGVATFYHLFRTQPAPPIVAHVCDDIACRLQGAEALCAALDAVPTSDAWTWHRSPCLGQCDRAPAVLMIRAGETPSAESLASVKDVAQIHARVNPVVGPGFSRALVRGTEPAPAPHVARLKPGPATGLLDRVGKVDPQSLEAYRAHGGYQALTRAFELGPEGVVAEVVASNLLGRGGAAFPTGRKWEAVARETGSPHYLVCNADESEPGTFKDRVLLEEDPFAIVEAMTLAAYATGCEQGYLYIRGEYPLALERMQDAIDAARAARLLGEHILGSAFAFDIEIRRGAGAYICGEETALFNSIEGKRGEPRSKPPFPVQVGLFNRPTLVNNVETLANVPGILLAGGRAWAATGTQASTGTRLFCLSGHVGRPGLYEAPFGITLGELIALAGGVANGRALQAVLLGGAAGTFVGHDALSLALTFEDARAAGATLGSGVVMVFDDTANLPDTLLRIAAFMRDESCGQCVPCRVGTVRQVELLHRLSGSAPAAPGDLQLLIQLGQAMRDASICGLGQTASSAVESAVARLRLFERGGPS